MLSFRQLSFFFQNFNKHFSIRTVFGICVFVNTFFGGLPAQAEMVTPPPPPSAPVDARGSLPMLPAYGVRDGFLLERPETSTDKGHYGVILQAMLGYNNFPLGQDYSIQHRLATHLGGRFSISDWGEVGVFIPFLLYQWYESPPNATTPLDIAHSAIGDLSVSGKASFNRLTQKYIRLALSGQITFDVGHNENSFFSGGKLPGGQVRLIVETPGGNRFLDHVSLYGNIGALFSDNTRPCASPTDPGTMDMPPSCNSLGKGLGTQLLYGIGIHGIPHHDFRISGELVGSYNKNSDVISRHPLMLAAKVQYLATSTTMINLSYGLGLNNDTPTHTAFIGFGWVLGK